MMAYAGDLTKDQTDAMKGLVDNLAHPPVHGYDIKLDKDTSDLLSKIQKQSMFQMFKNHGDGGDYDFKGKQNRERRLYIFILNGQVMPADQFGNDAAGYGASGNGPIALGAVGVAGLVYDATDSDGFNWDRDSSPDINQGYRDGRESLWESHPSYGQPPSNYNPYY